MKKISTDNLNLLYSKEDIQNGIAKLGEELNKYYNNEEVYMICVLKGAVFFAVDLAKHLAMPLKMEFIRLSSYGSSLTSSGKVNAVDISLPNLNEKNVLIVEDIIDTGHTAKFLIDFMKHNFKTKSLNFCSLLDKKIKREVDIDADFKVFDVDDKFLVGYGLDYGGHFRNLPYIGYLNM